MSVAEGFVEFLRKTPTQFHVVKECISRLLAAGFVRLSEKECWENKVKPKGRYFFTRNETSLFAFSVGEEYQKGDGFAIVAAHTDSPSLKLKPISKQESKGHLLLGVELYGGGKFYTWADRDLSLAGRVIVGKVCGVKSSMRRRDILRRKCSTLRNRSVSSLLLRSTCLRRRREVGTKWSSTKRASWCLCWGWVSWRRRRARWTSTTVIRRSWWI